MKIKVFSVHFRNNRLKFKVTQTKLNVKFDKTFEILYKFNFSNLVYINVNATWKLKFSLVTSGRLGSQTGELSLTKQGKTSLKSSLKKTLLSKIILWFSLLNTAGFPYLRDLPGWVKSPGKSLSRLVASK